MTPDQVDQTLRKPHVILGALAPLLILPVVVLLIFWGPFKWVLANQFPFSVFMMIVVLLIIVHLCALCILAERKIASWIQDRRGPNRVGWWGLLQPIADGVKFILKEDIVPKNVDKPLFMLAPVLSLTIALLGFAIIPWAGDVRWPWMPPGTTVSTQVANIDVGFLYLLAVASLGVYGVVLAGYASNNKYAFYGGMRATAQMLSYEVPLGLGLLVILLVAGTLRLDLIVNQQAVSGIWNVFSHPIAFILVLISAYAETNRTPFDLAEAEQELVGGYHTEYSAMKFAMFFLAEYAHMVTNSALIVALFFGGWHFWGLGPDNHEWWAALAKFGIFWAKVSVFLLLYMIIRWTIPRFRFDQLMRLAWKNLVPVGMVLVIAVGLLTYIGWHRNWLPSIAVNVLLILVALAAGALARKPVTGRQDNLPPPPAEPPRRGTMEMA